MQNCNIRTMTRKEVDIAIEWAAREGWNPGLHDAESYYSADPNGFFIGLLGEESIATLSAIKYDASFGFLGFYIVRPEYRGKGCGMQIWRAGLEYLEGRNIGLDSVIAQQENYEKSGFKLAYRNRRYEGRGSEEVVGNAGIVPITSLLFEAVVSYDRPFFPANRPQFVKSWINQPEGTAVGIMQNGKLSGYGVIRPCRSGYKIGPLFADNPELAEHLFLTLRSKVKSSEPVFLDTPEVNREATALAERHGMDVIFETARMYRGITPDMPINRLFGVTSFEVG